MVDLPVSLKNKNLNKKEGLSSEDFKNVLGGYTGTTGTGFESTTNGCSADTLVGALGSFTTNSYCNSYACGPG